MYIILYKDDNTNHVFAVFGPYNTAKEAQKEIDGKVRIDGTMLCSANTDIRYVIEPSPLTQPSLLEDI